MENNILAEIFVAQQKIDGCLAVTPPINPSYTTSNNTDVNSSHSSSVTSVSMGNVTSGASVPSSSSVIPTNTVSGDAAASPFMVTIGDAIQRETSGGLISKSKYVVYEISVRRLVDGVEHKVYHRFRDIKTLYYSLMMEFEDIEYNSSVKFPTYEASWTMSSNQSNNPNSELVVRRRSDLQVFFYELFKYYPFLFNHPRVQEFFNLKSLHASSVSTFSTHLLSNTTKSGDSISAGKDTQTAPEGGVNLNYDPLLGYTEQQLNSGWEYDVLQGRLINKNTWQEVSPPPRPMSYVDFSNFNEWYETKARAT